MTNLVKQRSQVLMIRYTQSNAAKPFSRRCLIPQIALHTERARGQRAHSVAGRLHKQICATLPVAVLPARPAQARGLRLLLIKFS